MYRVLGKGITTDRQLNTVGKQIFGKEWLGVFPSDVKPYTLMKNATMDGKSYGIINVDGSGEPGSHWYSIFRDASQPNAKWYLWDSFARKSTRMIPKFIKTIGYRYIDLNKTADQKKSELDCGARAMAVLAYIKKYGIQSAAGV